jgi:hypothetical protein
VRFHVEAVGDRVVARELMAMAGRTLDEAPAMQAIIDGLYESARRQFDSQGAYGGTPWPADADSTVERKARAGLDPRILHATLRLRESLTQPGGENVAIAEADGVIFDTTVPYADYLRERYPMVRPPEAERREWVKVIQKWIIDGDASRGGILGGIV